MGENLELALVQCVLSWENISSNLEHIGGLIDKVKADIFILPEMFSTGFTMNTSIAETMDGRAVNWMRVQAARKNAVIAGSLIIKENDKVFNRFIWMSPDGDHKQYDKRHLFRMADEHQHFSSGNQKIIIDYHGWKICPLICYDLRFPVWSRNRSTSEGESEYDLLLYVANWPEKRRTPWNVLLPARAVENLCYCVGVNRVGEDGNGIPYSGDSAVYNYKGEVVGASEPYEETVKLVSISYSELMAFRRAFPAGLDADRFDIR